MAVALDAKYLKNLSFTSRSSDPANFR